MNLRILTEKRIGKKDIMHICELCRNDCTGALKEELYSLISEADARTGYNALWVLTHFSDEDLRWLQPERNKLIDYLLSTDHTGKKRTLLTILDRLAADAGDIRTDYLDYCLRNINSAEPYAIRALCMKQAYAMCSHFPDLLQEFMAEMELLDQSQLSPGLSAARRNILKKVRPE